MADHYFVHQEAQFVVDSLLDRQPVQLLQCSSLGLQIINYTESNNHHLNLCQAKHTMGKAIERIVHERPTQPGHRSAPRPPTPAPPFFSSPAHPIFRSAAPFSAPAPQATFFHASGASGGMVLVVYTIVHLFHCNTLSIRQCHNYNKMVRYKPGCYNVVIYIPSRIHSILSIDCLSRPFCIGP